MIAQPCLISQLFCSLALCAVVVFWSRKAVMMFPKVPKTVFAEGMGAIHVAWVVNAAQCLWRPTLRIDLAFASQDKSLS
jgi:hypothetical protein